MTLTIQGFVHGGLVGGAFYGGLIGGYLGFLYSNRPVRIAGYGVGIGVQAAAFGILFGPYGFYASLCISALAVLSSLVNKRIVIQKNEPNNALNTIQNAITKN